jgi:hypothetical protein
MRSFEALRGLFICVCVYGGRIGIGLGPGLGIGFMICVGDLIDWT